MKVTRNMVVSRAGGRKQDRLEQMKELIADGLVVEAPDGGITLGEKIGGAKTAVVLAIAELKDDFVRAAPSVGEHANGVSPVHAEAELPAASDAPMMMTSRERLIALLRRPRPSEEELNRRHLDNVRRMQTRR